MTNEVELQSQTAMTEPATPATDPMLDSLRKVAHEEINRRDYETVLAALQALVADPLGQAIRRVLMQPSKMYWTPNEVLEELLQSKAWAPLSKWGQLEPHNQKKNIATISNLLVSNTSCAHNPSDNTFCLRKRLP